MFGGAIVSAQSWWRLPVTDRRPRAFRRRLAEAGWPGRQAGRIQATARRIIRASRISRRHRRLTRLDVDRARRHDFTGMTKPLEGRTVIVTRAASQAEELSTVLENYGANVIACPTIEIRELANYER